MTWPRIDRGNGRGRGLAQPNNIYLWGTDAVTWGTDYVTWG